MTFSKEQRKIAYKKLSPEVQNFIMDSGTTELITNYLTEARLTEDQSDIADSEILYAMYGLQTLTEAVANIAKLSNKNSADLSKLKNNLENNIFSKIPANTGNSSPSVETNKIEVEKINPEMLKNLPQKIQDYIAGGELAKRIDEISKKYNLNEPQKSKLLDFSTSVFVNPDNRNNLSAKILSILSVSSLLADQIANDLNSRVFDYALKQLESKPENKPVPIQEAPSIPKPTPSPAYKVPEIKPNNLPIKQAPQPVKNVTPPYASPAKSADRPSAQPQTAPEVIQRPVSVPRFRAAPEEKLEEKVAPIVVPPANNPPQNIPQGMPPKPEIKPEVNQNQKYSSDPYREPVE